MSSGGKSKSESSNRSRQMVDPAQAPFLDWLRQAGTGLAQQQLGAGSPFQQGVVNPAFGAIGSFLGPYEQSPGLTGQIEQGQELINRNLQENILPGIGSSAGMAGQMGGSRQGVAEGIASRAAIEQSADFAQNMMFNDYQRYQQQRMQALGMAPQMAGLQFAPLTNLAGILGRPTVLGSSRGSSNSKGLDVGFQQPGG